MASNLERQIKILESKKGMIIGRLAELFKAAQTRSGFDSRSNTQFLISSECVESLRDRLEKVVDELNLVKMELDPESKIDYTDLARGEEYSTYVISIRRELLSARGEGVAAKPKSAMVKLPPIEIPAFDGSLESWPLFYKSFKTNIHDNPNLDDSLRVQYLIGKLSEDALHITDGLVPTGETYRFVWDNLVKKYEDRRSLATHYIDQISKIEKCKGDVTGLLLFVQRYFSATSAIKQLGLEDLADFLLFHMGFKKLDTQTALEYESSIRGVETPTVESLVKFVQDRVKILKRAQSVEPETPERTRSKTPPRGTPTSKGVKFGETHTFVTTESAKIPCDLCKGSDHWSLYRCPSFLALGRQERFAWTKNKNLCLNCLSAGHYLSKCPSKGRCRICNSKKHHSLLCTKETGKTGETQPGSNTNVAETTVLSSHDVRIDPRPTVSTGDAPTYDVTNSYVTSTTLLATARVVVVDSKGKVHSIRALLDSASQSSFVTRNCCQLLGLNVEDCSKTYSVKGIGETSQQIHNTAQVKFSPHFDLSTTYEVNALVIENISGILPATPVQETHFRNIRKLRLADPDFTQPKQIDLLLGASIFPHLILARRVKDQSGRGAVAVETTLGYVVMGDAPMCVEPYTGSSRCHVVESLDTLVRRFWDVDEPPPRHIRSLDEEACEEFYVRTTSREDCGRYMVALPFRESTDALGDSRRASERRFLQLERRLESSPGMRAAYNEAILDYLNKGILSPVTETGETEGGQYFIPHHGVFKESKLSSKLRIVLDGSCRTSSGVAINDLLYGGENLQGNITDIILGFRLFPIALSADIKQMFLNIGVRKEDRRFQRILYRFSPQEPLRVYQFNRVVFGFKSSPFLALRTLQQLAADEGDSHPKAKNILRSNFYMDDFVCSVDCEEEASEVITDLIALLKKGGFELTKWATSSSKVEESIPAELRLASSKKLDDWDHSVLGLGWSPHTDVLELRAGEIPGNWDTKRGILSCVARLWDVMGFVAPVTLYAKLLIKRLWACGCDWDDPLPDDVSRDWARFREELPQLKKFQLPRYVGVSNNSNVTILGFADASERGYGGVVYLHVENGEKVSVELVAAKARVAPQKTLTVARLELCAVLVLAKLIDTVRRVCGARVSGCSVRAFSDSRVALCWVHSSPHRWETFVANRVTLIREYLDPGILHHIRGEENPADCLSRGLTPAELISHPLWFRGPGWISRPRSQWSLVPFDPSSVPEPPGQRSTVLCAASPAAESDLLTSAARLSSWKKLLRVVTYVLRFGRVLKTRGLITSPDLDISERYLVQGLQRLHFGEDLDRLKGGKPCRRAIQNLRPFLDGETLRVGGRLRWGDLPFDQKHPVVLPKRAHVVNLLIDHYHRANCHAGPELLLSLLRQKYWIMSARSVIRSRIHKCLPCFRSRARPLNPEMADLRRCRIVENVKPFIHTGVDYAGPFRITAIRGRGVRAHKGYLCLFVCLTTRALHLEPVGDLSSAGFIGAFKRFLSRRGPISHIYSDNGTNFVGAQPLLTDLHNLLSSPDFKKSLNDTLLEDRIYWHFNPPAAPHFGGDWEANIKSVKSHLLKVVGDQVLTFEEFSTVLAQIEAILNSRPLCRSLSSDPSEPLALTPAHFLTLTPLRHLPAESVDDRLNMQGRHKLIIQLVRSFWERWRTEYLHTLQSLAKWNTPGSPIEIGQVVIIKTDNSPPLRWPLGIVEKVHPGKDGIVRTVQVRTGTGSYLRPVVRLCPLPQ